MFKSISVLLPLLFGAASVAAHGVVTSITIDGKTYAGNLPNAPTKPSIIRQVADVGPVKGATNPDLNCGLNAQAASLVADANPGSKISFDWRGGDNSPWPHNTGPMLTYMASCGDQTCDKFDPAQAKWFKIQQVGKKDNGDWAQADLMKGAQADVTIPATLAPGNYMIRHEIIALHLAVTKGGAEFYPSCAQLRIGGSQSGAPQASELVSLPGAYSDNDPGIFDPSVFDRQSGYVFPGPKVASFVGDGASSGGVNGGNNGNNGNKNNNNGGNSTSAPAPAPSSTPKPAKSCSLKKKKPSSSAASAAPSASATNYVPRHLSRVMRRLVAGSHHVSGF